MNFPASVANKGLTLGLSPLNATLTKTRGGTPNSPTAPRQALFFFLFRLRERRLPGLPRAARGPRRGVNSASFSQPTTVDSQLLLALHSSDGNTAAAFTLDGETGPHDAHRCWEHGSWIFAQSSRQQGILAQHPAGARPRRSRFFQNLLSRLPIPIPFPRTPLQTL